MRLATSSIPLSRSIAASLMLCCAQPCQSTFATMGTRPHKSGFQKCSSVVNSLACRNANLFSQSCALFADLQVLRRRQFCTCGSANRALATVLRTFCPTATTEPLYPKKYRVSRPRVFSPVTSHAAELLHFPTT